MICGYCSQAGCEDELCRITCDCGKQKKLDSAHCGWCKVKIKKLKFKDGAQ